MGRQPEIEKIIEAWWELDHCAPPERSKLQLARNQLLDAAVAKSRGLCTRQQILNGLWPRYKEYRKKKHKQESVQVAQTALKKS